MGSAASLNCLKTKPTVTEEITIDNQVLYYSAQEQESLYNQGLIKNILVRTQDFNEIFEEEKFEVQNRDIVEKDFEEVKYEVHEAPVIIEDLIKIPKKKEKNVGKSPSQKAPFDKIPFERIPDEVSNSYSLGEVLSRSKLSRIDLSVLVEGVKYPINYFYRLYDGSVYRGEMDEKFRPHGRGILFFPDGSIYIGYFSNGHAKGEGKYLDSRKVLTEGKFISIDEEMSSTQNGMSLVLHGPGSESWPDGTHYLGDFHMGTKQGRGQLKHKDFTYEGEFYNDLFSGSGTLTLTSGDVFTGHWKDGMKHGEGEFKEKCGLIYKGQFKNDEKSGQGTMLWPDRRRYEGQWKKGKKHGIGIYTYFDQSKGRLRTGRSEWRHGDRVRWLSPSADST